MACTFSQANGASLWTSGVVYEAKSPVHSKYMARTKDQKGDGRKSPPRPPAAAKLPWRITRIRLWRERADMTQQEVADRLVMMDPDLDYTRTSVQRIETGKQRPPVVVLEAMVVMFGAPNLSAMLDRTPEEAEALRKVEELDPKEVRRLLRILEAGRDEGG